MCRETASSGRLIAECHLLKIEIVVGDKTRKMDVLGPRTDS